MGSSGCGQISTRSAVFLDRDGVIVEAVIRNGKPYPPPSLQQMRIVTSARAALFDLKTAGFLVIVVTNQPDVARGIQSRMEIERMHAALRQQLPIDDIFACYHDDRDACSCRKPNPGLLVEACGRYGIDLRCSFLIGDRWRDIDAGRAAGCSTVWIDQGYIEPGPSQAASARVTCLRDAVAWIRSQSKFQEQRKWRT
jgi:D-glycero-D-manno-heptose 1,7-bisphosphate phosphatase